MKKYIKKVRFLYYFYRFIDPYIRRILFRVSPLAANRYLYRTVFGRRMNLKNPAFLSEKLMFLKIYTRDPLWVTCTDKYKVRAFVEERGCGNILNEVYGVYDRVVDIEWELLPNQFVLKGTHGCGCNIICIDKNKFDQSKAYAKLDAWMKIDYAKFMGESHYSQITPRIVAEKFLGDASGELPVDYKILCFNGAPKVFLVCTERSTELKLTFLDLEWNILDINSDGFPAETCVEKPVCLDKMVTYAKRLAAGFHFVRVDFYVVNSEIVFGEMTFTPAGGIVAYFSEKGDRVLGELLSLPNRREN